ncbi:MAG: hypothetical protein IKJ13_03165 [Clostridia bacterium]|nr:hypothetical protein [Clostridia bacterium]
MIVEKNDYKGLTLEFLFSLIILLCIFLGSLNLINRYYYCIFIAAIFFIITPKRKMRFNFDFTILFCFSLSILLFDPSSQTMITNMIKPFTYPLCYFMGLSLFSGSSEGKTDILQQEKRTSLLIYVISGGVMSHFILNMITNRGVEDRNVIDFWTQDAMSATGQATLACLMIAVSVAFLFSNTSKIKKVIAIVSLLLITAYNLILAGRTIFMLILVTLGAAYLFTLFVKKVGSLKVFIVMLVVILILLTLYNNNAFGIKTSFEMSNFYDRFFGGDVAQEIDDDSRMENKLYYVEHFFDSMLGGGNIRAEFGHSSHDLYLDTYDESGIFALLTIAVYIIMSIYRAVKCARSKKLSFEMKMLLVCIYTTVNIQFWLEPILRGVPWLLAAYCLIDGAVTRLLIEEKNIDSVS